MSVARKYSGLPDIDDAAPDVYQTPSLIDDASTVPGTTTTATTARSASPTSSAPEDGDDGAGIDRRHVMTADARSRFRGTRVGAEGVDFADRLHSRSYWTYSSGARRRRVHDGDGEGEDDEDSEDDDEDVEARVARLRREVEEVRALCERRAAAAAQEQAPGGDGGPLLKSVDGISAALDSVYERRHGGAKGAQRELVRSLRAMEGEPVATAAAPRDRGDGDASSPETVPKDRAEAASHALELAAAFDARLTALESAFGLAASGGGSEPSPSLDAAAAASRPVLPALAGLERTLALATGQPGALDAAQAKVRALLKDAERLARLRAEEQQHEGGAASAGGGTPSSSEQSKIMALYGLLPTIESLAPTLPLVLERLRTLRLLHAGAADASGALEAVEKRQEEQAEELKTWRAALEKVEGGLKDGQGALVENMEKMGGWIRDVEARMDRLA